jgi:para-aminobenzoate synthetase/4-amino-4-deoxychorismate lyase
VLLDDSRRPHRAGPSYLFHDLVHLEDACDGDVIGAFARLRDLTAASLWVAGWIGYEAGYALEPRLRPLMPPVGTALLGLGGFRHRTVLTPAQVGDLLPAPQPMNIAAPVPEHWMQVDYEAAVRQTLAAIAAGDIYQANITFGARVAVGDDPLALYAALRARQRVRYGALIHLGEQWLLSASPELFFALEDGQLTAQPMKGTAPRAALPDADTAVALTLKHDPKNRAENLMIVDLLRNDLARVAVTGSVRVPALFETQALETVHQMTSTITAQLRPGCDAYDALTALFPCGSITGAPKIRAMEIIAGLEPTPRGAYCGAIGWIGPGNSEQPGDAGFNVAIRTLSLTGDGHARLGLGAGIVAESDPAAEWAECQLKAAFLSQPAPAFDLITTLRWTPGEGFWLLPLHLDRLTASAAWFDYPGERAHWQQVLEHAAQAWTSPMRVRLRVPAEGAAVVEAVPLPPAPAEPVDVVLWPTPLDAPARFIAHKTTHRAFYDDPRLASGAFEVLFTNADGQLTEGSITNLFIERGGRLLTPPVGAGLLRGVLRRHLLETGAAEEAPLWPADLARADRVLVGNAVRGLMVARVRPAAPLPA